MSILELPIWISIITIEPFITKLFFNNKNSCENAQFAIKTVHESMNKQTSGYVPVQDVKDDSCTCMAKMAEIVSCNATDVHAYLAFSKRLKSLFLLRQ